MKIHDIKIGLDDTQDDYTKAIAQKLECSEKDISNIHLTRKSIDARKKNNVHFVCSFDFSYKDIPEEDHINSLNITYCKNIKLRPIVIGSGPAGMFAGLILAEAGLKPIILERGKPVNERKKDIDIFWKTGKLNPNSNVQFGEGGAGTFSDGKLMSGIKKDIYTQKVLEEFVKAGAPSEILYLAKPHIGTDNLAIVVQNIRKRIENLGGEYRFENRVYGFEVRKNELKAVKIIKKETEKDLLTCDDVVLAIGHSSRDTFEELYKLGINLEQKTFSVGARIEHKQEMINKSQYGNFAGHKALGAADYKLSCHLNNGKGVYTFCMCPGGEVVAAASEEGRLVTNGMSEFARNKENSNAALLVNVDTEDFASKHPLAGMYFQRKIEERAFIAGGKNYNAPAQLVGDFLKKKSSTKFNDIHPSYSCGVVPANLDEILPEHITDAMRSAILDFDRKLSGFASYNAVLTAPETRSSSPVRIIRQENGESSIKGIYPCGEGAGYAGGIMSAAVDGIKIALKIVEKYI